MPRMRRHVRHAGGAVEASDRRPRRPRIGGWPRREGPGWYAPRGARRLGATARLARGDPLGTAHGGGGAMGGSFAPALHGSPEPEQPASEGDRGQAEPRPADDE